MYIYILGVISGAILHYLYVQYRKYVAYKQAVKFFESLMKEMEKEGRGDKELDKDKDKDKQ